MEIICTTVTVVGSIIVAIVGAVGVVYANKISKLQRISEQQNEMRKREARLAMKLSAANTKLTVGVAMALKHGHANGEIEEGLADVDKAQQEYSEFLAEVATEHLIGG